MKVFGMSKAFTTKNAKPTKRSWAAEREALLKKLRGPRDLRGERFFVTRRSTV
jgi:hypothetical protein